MILGRVTGAVHASVKNAHLVGERLLVVRPVDLSGSVRGRPIVCLDRVDAGPGELVLVNKEGGGARLLYDNERIPVQGVITCVVDHVDVEEEAP